MTRKHYYGGYVSAARQSRKDEQWKELEEAFDDFVDTDVMEVTGGGEAYNQLAEAADRLLDQVKEIIWGSI